MSNDREERGVARFLLPSVLTVTPPTKKLSGDKKDVAKNNQRDPNLRAATVARVNQLAKGGMSKAAAFEKISAETGRAKDAVQMLYYRAIRAAKAGKSPKATAAKAPAVKAAVKAAPKAPAASAPAPAPARKSRRRSAPKASAGARSADFLTVLKGVENAINNLLIHFEKTVAENETLKEQAKRLQAITSLIRGR